MEMHIVLEMVINLMLLSLSLLWKILVSYKYIINILNRMKVALENLSKHNELLNQKTIRSVNSIKPDSTGNVQLGTVRNN